MPTGTFAFSAGAFTSSFNKEVDWNDGGTKIMLSTVTYVFDPDTHLYKSSVANEVTGTNWPAGGVNLANLTISVVAASNRVKIVVDDVVNATTTLTGGRTASVYNNTPATDAARPVLGAIVFDSDLSPGAATLTLDFDNTNGLGYITY